MQQSFSLEIIQGRDALALLEDSYFRASWDALYAACPWQTVFQHKSFVLNWYKHYAGLYMPIIVKALQDGKLLGLLTLARKPEAKIIQVAGFREAHYQVWLTDPVLGSSFIKEAIRVLYREFPQDEINFYNIPPQTPLDWLEELPNWSYPHTIRSFDRPLMKLKERGYVGRTLNTKRFRKRLSQLKKLGNVQFEQITDLGQFEVAIEEMALQFDFRKAAKYNWTEFQSDPMKKPFMVDLFKEGILRVSLLKLNGQIIASLVDTVGTDNWLHGTEISTFSCFHAKHSPGMLCFMLLGQQLATEGYNVYDLTPGSDWYKQRLANDHDHVHELRFTPSVKSLLLRKSEMKLRNLAGSLLRLTQLNPKSVLDSMHRLSYQARSFHRLFHNAYGTSHKTGHCGYTVAITPNARTYPTGLKEACLKDLLLYTPQKNEVPRWDFLAEAMEYIENDCIPYTLSQDGRLLFCCWHIHNTAMALKLCPSLPADSVLLYGAYHREIPLEFVHKLVQQSALQASPDSNKRVILMLHDKQLANELSALCYQ